MKMKLKMGGSLYVIITFGRLIVTVRSAMKKAMNNNTENFLRWSGSALVPMNECIVKLHYLPPSKLDIFLDVVENGLLYAAFAAGIAIMVYGLIGF